MSYKFLSIFLLLAATSCSTEYGDYQYVKLASNKKDTIYVKSYNWGVTGNGQLSSISDNSDPIELLLLESQAYAM